MKISLNTAYTVNRHIKEYKQHNQSQKRTSCYQSHNNPCNAVVPVLSFQAKPDSVMLLAQTDKLRCAYSGEKMLSPYMFRSICAKLSKKNNAQSAINFLKEYQEYMPTVETEIFDMFTEYSNGGKKTLQDILLQEHPKALTRLREKQRNVLISSDENINMLDKDIAEEVLGIRDAALIGIEDGTFSRHKLLERLKIINSQDARTKHLLNNIYAKWYTLPRSYMDYDAFIVKYSKFPHEEIAQRLLSMSVATVEHIKPYAKGGKDHLWNYALVCRLYNTDKEDMNLSEYNELNPEIGIQKNLLKYINNVSNEIEKGNKYFEVNYLYPKQLGQNIFLETGWKEFNEINDDMRNFRNTPKLTSSKKGNNRYITNHK